MYYHIDNEVQPKEAPGLTPSDQSPRSHAANLQEKVNRLRARQVDLEAAEAELERQRQDFARQQTTHHLGDDDDARTGAPSGLRFPRTAYNMAAAACQLENISNTPDLKTNEQLNEAKRLLRVALEQ
jgi:hypothetical protein